MRLTAKLFPDKMEIVAIADIDPGKSGRGGKRI